MMGTKMRKVTRRAVGCSVSRGSARGYEKLTKGEGGGEEDVAVEETGFGIGSKDVGGLFGSLLLLVDGLGGGVVVVGVLGDGGETVGLEIGGVVFDELGLVVVVVVELSLGLEVESGGGSGVVRGCGEDEEVRGGEGFDLAGDGCVWEYEARVSRSAWGRSDELTDVGEEGGLILGKCVLKSIEYVNLDLVLGGGGEGGFAAGEEVGDGAIEGVELVLGEIVVVERKVSGVSGGVVGFERAREMLEVLRVEPRHGEEQDRRRFAVLYRFRVGEGEIGPRRAERHSERERGHEQRGVQHRRECKRSQSSFSTFLLFAPTKFPHHHVRSRRAPFSPRSVHRLPLTLRPRTTAFTPSHSSQTSLSFSSAHYPPATPVNQTKILLLANFSSDLKTRDLQLVFQDWEDERGGFKLKWIDDQSCYVVFADATVAKRAYLTLLTNPPPSLAVSLLHAPKLSAYAGPDTAAIITAVANRPRSRSTAVAHSRNPSSSQTHVRNKSANLSFGSAANLPPGLAHHLRGKSSLGQNQLATLITADETSTDLSPPPVPTIDPQHLLSTPTPSRVANKVGASGEIVVGEIEVGELSIDDE